MDAITEISSLFKKNHRLYSMVLLKKLEDKGFTDLRVSFIEIMIFLMDHDGSSIKSIGFNCALKKQTMTTHINELEKRGYIKRQPNRIDRREQQVFLTHYGESFNQALALSLQSLNQDLEDFIGAVELERLLIVLKKINERFIKQV